METKIINKTEVSTADDTGRGRTSSNVRRSILKARSPGRSKSPGNRSKSRSTSKSPKRAPEKRKYPKKPGKKVEKLIYNPTAQDLRREAEERAKAIFLPASYPPTRDVGEFSGMPSVVSKPWTEISMPWISATSVSVNYRPLPETDCLVYLFRRFECAMILYDPNADGLTAVYNFKGSGGVLSQGTPPSFSWGLDTEAMTEGRAVPLHMPYALINDATGWAPHGSMWFAACSNRGDSSRYFWFDGSGGASGQGARFNATFTRTDSTVLALFKIVLDRWTPQGVEESAYFQTITFAIGSLTASLNFTADQSGYYAFKVMAQETNSVEIGDIYEDLKKSKLKHDLMEEIEECMDEFKRLQKKEDNNNSCSASKFIKTATGETRTRALQLRKKYRQLLHQIMDEVCISVPTSITVSSFNVSLNNAVFGHQALPGIENNINVISSSRINAASVEYSNTSSTLNDQGKVCGVQSPEGEFWFKYTQSYESVSKSPNASNKDDVENIKLGIYGFLKNSKTTDAKYNAYTTCQNGIVLDSAWPLDLDKNTSFLVVRGSIDQPDGRSGLLNVCWHIEYLSMDVWRDARLAKQNEALDKLVREIVNNAKQWTHNPDHLATFLGYARKAGKFVANLVKDYGPAAVQLAKTISV